MTNLQNYVLRKIKEQLDPEEQSALDDLVSELLSNKVIDFDAVTTASSLSENLDLALKEKRELKFKVESLESELDAAANREMEAKATIIRLQKEIDGWKHGAKSVPASSPPIEVVAEKPIPKPTKFVPAGNDPSLPCFTTPTTWEGELLECGSFEIPVPIVKAAVLGLVAEQPIKDIAQNLTLKQDAVHAIRSSFEFGFAYLRTLDSKERGAHIDGYIAKKMGGADDFCSSSRNRLGSRPSRHCSFLQQGGGPRG